MAEFSVQFISILFQFAGDVTSLNDTLIPFFSVGSEILLANGEKKLEKYYSIT